MKRMFIDVREPYEYAAGHVAGAINLPVSELPNAATVLKDIPKDTELIVYCQSGNRSGASIKVLQQQGYTNVVNGINKHQVEANYDV